MSRRSFASGTGSGPFSTAVPGGWRGGASRSGIIVVLLGVILGGCATKGDVRDLREDLMEEMQERGARQDSILAAIEERQRESQEQLVDQQAQVIQEFRRDLDRQLTSLEDELLRTQEIAGQSQRQMAQLQDLIEARGAPVPDGGARGRPGGDRDEDDPWGGAGADENGEEAELFDGAIQALERGQTGTARRGFQELISDFPNHELVPRARYYLADIQARQAEDDEDYEEAIDAFLEIAQYHPGADAVPEAYLRVGEIHLEDLGDEEEARDYFQRIIDSFPDSEAAQLARDHLDALG